MACYAVFKTTLTLSTKLLSRYGEDKKLMSNTEHIDAVDA
jgi:hypothetical protein